MTSFWSSSQFPTLLRSVNCPKKTIENVSNSPTIHNSPLNLRRDLHNFHHDCLLEFVALDPGILQGISIQEDLRRAADRRPGQELGPDGAALIVVRVRAEDILIIGIWMILDEPRLHIGDCYSPAVGVDQLDHRLHRFGNARVRREEVEQVENGHPDVFLPADLLVRIHREDIANTERDLVLIETISNLHQIAALRVGWIHHKDLKRCQLVLKRIGFYQIEEIPRDRANHSRIIGLEHEFDAVSPLLVSFIRVQIVQILKKNDSRIGYSNPRVFSRTRKASAGRWPRVLLK